MCGAIISWLALLPLRTAVAASSNTFGSVTGVSRVVYFLQQFLLKRAVLVVVAFAAGAAVLGGLIFRLVTEDSLGEGTFRAYALLNNVPGVDAVNDETPLARLVSNVIYMVGVATFAVIIGLASERISSSVDGLRVSNARVQEVGHTVVVNWGEYTRPMMRQLEAARREGRLSGTVLVLADKDKEEMDEVIEDELGRIPGARLNVLTRKGSPLELNHMDRVAAATARRIILLPPGGDGAADDEGADKGGGDDADGASQLRDSTGLALALQRGVQPSQQKRASVVVSAPAGYNLRTWVEQDGFRSYAEVRPEDFISRILAQCAVQPALSRVYAELLMQGGGSEVYMEPLSKHRALHGGTFGQARKAFNSAIAIGLVRGGADGAEERVELSPPDELELGPSDSMVLIAKDKRDARRVGRAPRAPKPTPTADGAAPAASAASASASASAPRLSPMRILLLNADPSMPDFIEQIDEITPKGSSLTLVSPPGAEKALPRSLKHLKLEVVEGDPSDPVELGRLRAETFDAVVCLQPGGGSDADDAKLLVSLISLEQAARAGDAPSPKVVGEVYSPSMLELIGSRWPAETWDFVLPNELCAGILVQFALQPELRTVYDELLSKEGKEIFLCAASRYLDLPDEAAPAAGADAREGAAPKGGAAARPRRVSFEELSSAARARGEIAIGIQRAGEKEPRLNPPRNMRFKLEAADQVVVIGDAL